jgi:hypothetical protein
VVAALQAGRGVGADIAGLTIQDFRRAAGRPDNAHAVNPGGADDFISGARTLWPRLAVKATAVHWAAARGQMARPDTLAVLMVRSAELAPAHRYGFAGFHALTVRLLGAQWWAVNPLQPKGSIARRYSEAELHAAAAAYPAGVQAVIFRPAAPVIVAPIPPPAPAPDPSPFTQSDLDAAHEAGRVAGIGSAIAAAEGLL